MAALVRATKQMLPSGVFLVGGPWWAVVAPRRSNSELEKEYQSNRVMRLYETLDREVHVEETSQFVLQAKLLARQRHA
jgi:hypothetical protein